MFYGQLVTGRTPRRRPTDEQRQLAGQWLAQTGRAVTAEAVAELAPHVRVTGKPEPHEVQAYRPAGPPRSGADRGCGPGAVHGEMASRSAGATRFNILRLCKRQLQESVFGQH